MSQERVPETHVQTKQLVFYEGYGVEEDDRDIHEIFSDIVEFNVELIKETCNMDLVKIEGKNDLVKFKIERSKTEDEECRIGEYGVDIYLYDYIVYDVTKVDDLPEFAKDILKKEGIDPSKLVEVYEIEGTPYTLKRGSRIWGDPLIRVYVLRIRE